MRLFVGILAGFGLLGHDAMALQCLPMPDQASAIARSVQQGIAMGVKDDSPWWAQAKINNQWCVIIEIATRADPGYDFTANPIPVSVNDSAPVGIPTGLTPAEIQSLIPIIPSQEIPQ